ncbi:MAG: ribonuclease R [Lachnospiraceae bacterium]|nr:ribonuclease R [Lachnospiraceae bacterium]
MEQIMNERKEMLLELFGSPLYKPMKLKELAYFCQVRPEERKVFESLLETLVAEGKIMVTAKGKYQLMPKEFISGVYTGHPKGFGFVEAEGEEKEFFISENDTMGAFYRDLVLCKITKDNSANRDKKSEAQVVKILKHQVTELVGVYQQSKSFGFVIPDNKRITKDIFVSKKNTLGAVDGQKVVVRITDYGSNEKKPEGQIAEILGHVNDPGVDIISVVRGYELPVEFPQTVMDSLAKIPDTVDSKDIAGRMDIRDWLTVTIDGEDAKDLDDAVTLSETADGYELGVHIADVSHYVEENSPLDQEALNRGTSVYLVDRVIPMLPHKLSNGICSLNEGVDRLALSCIMTIDRQGNVVGHKICETVIRVNHRMSYTDVNKIITERDAACMEKYADSVTLFETMLRLSDILREKRTKRGSVDFDFPESKIELDENGIPLSVAPYERNRAHLIIEDFMLAANETVAEDYFWQELPFVYRTHEAPDAEKIKALLVMMENYGYYFKASKEHVHPKEIQKLLARIAGSPEEAVLSRLTLRSMKQAKYTTVCTGHFGLATNYYCHFTSPIRRYPDLQIHRIIKENLHAKLDEKRIRHYDKLLIKVADANSKAERRASDAERDVEKMKKAQYMAGHIGEVYEGVISGVTGWGIYVELPNTVEGLVHVTNLLDDYYYYDEEAYAMIGERMGKTYTLGMKVKVYVEHVDKIRWQIDFLMCDETEEDK